MYTQSFGKLAHSRQARLYLILLNATNSRDGQVSLARPAHEESPELVECFRHEGEEYPRCDGSGFRPPQVLRRVRRAGGQFERGYRLPAGQGSPNGRLYHVRCLPGTHDLDAVWSGLERMAP